MTDEKFEQATICIQEGDIITSKKGILMQSEITKQNYKVFKQEYRGNGCWLVIDKKKS